MTADRSAGSQSGIITLSSSIDLALAKMSGKGDQLRELQRDPANGDIVLCIEPEIGGKSTCIPTSG
jgi:hypothetical protein